MSDESGEVSAATPQAKMRDVEEQLLHNTLRVVGVDADGKGFSGTAFLYSKSLPDGRGLQLLVSNKHVLKRGAQKLVVIGLAKGEDGPVYGKAVHVDVTNSEIFDHPDDEVDVAALNFSPYSNTNLLFAIELTEDNILPEPSADNGHKPSTFEKVLFVGYPNGLSDEENVLPLARFGNLSTQLNFDYQGKPAFLIDAAVFGGSSGSPVFVYRKFQRSTAKGITFGDQPHFVGVLAAVHIKTHGAPVVEVEQADTEQAAVISSELGLGIVFKAKTIIEVSDLVAASLGLVER